MKPIVKSAQGNICLTYADDVNLLEDNINTTQKNKEALIYASKEVGQEENTEKTMYMLMSHHQNAGFKYLGMTVANQNLIKKTSEALVR
jgi:hypothetical protein